MCVNIPRYMLQKRILISELSEHVESCTLTTKNIRSLLEQSLWLPKLAGWLLNVRESHP